MTRMAVKYLNNNFDDEWEQEVTLADGEDWSQCVLDDMENANWHTERHVFAPLIHLLPEIYKVLDPKLQKRLQDAVDAWDREF